MTQPRRIETTHGYLIDPCAGFIKHHKFIRDLDRVTITSLMDAMGWRGWQGFNLTPKIALFFDRHAQTKREAGEYANSQYLVAHEGTDAEAVILGPAFALAADPAGFNGSIAADIGEVAAVLSVSLMAVPNADTGRFSHITKPLILPTSTPASTPASSGQPSNPHLH